MFARNTFLSLPSEVVIVPDLGAWLGIFPACASLSHPVAVRGVVPLRPLCSLFVGEVHL